MIFCRVAGCRTACYLFFICLLLHLSAATAATFTVTSTADAGPGTLREAIAAANANGVTTRDYIYFNLPGTAQTARSINLVAALPALTSNIEIDGTTQPGAAFGVSDAKVRITKVGEAPLHACAFLIANASDVAIYGIFFETDQDLFTICIRIDNASQVMIGAPGKGNVFLASYGAIDAEYTTDAQPNDNHCDAITISNNIFGYEADGVTRPTDVYNDSGVTLYNVSNVRVNDNNMNASLEIKYVFVTSGPSDFGIDISQNTIGVVGISSTQGAPGSPTSKPLKITGNWIPDGGIAITGTGPFVIQGNRINTDAAGATNIFNNGDEAIAVDNCSFGVLIGGSDPGDKNVITGGIYGVHVFNSSPVTISRNSIFCNRTGIEPYSYDPHVEITQYGNTQLGGTATANADIEIFQAYKCGDAPNDCEGKTYIATVHSDASGNWRYNGAISGSIVATATDAGGNTSRFSKTVLNSDPRVITDATCTDKGSITGIQIAGAASYQWEDSKGNVVGHGADLLDMPPGVYYLYASATNDPHSGCGEYVAWEIRDLRPRIDLGKMTVHNPCSDHDGYIQNIDALGSSYKWTNEKGETVGNTADLYFVPAGTYTLTASRNDLCFATSAPVTLAKMAGPAIDISHMLVTPATCSGSNGNITGVAVSGTPPYNYVWKNATGADVNDAADFHDVAPGQYSLTVTDNTGCTVSTTAAITMPDNSAITLDETTAVVKPTSCNNSTGSITGISVSAVGTYTWTNAIGGVVGRDLDLTGVPAGTYTLIVQSTGGCTTTSQPYTVSQSQPVNWTATNTTLPPTCNNHDGRFNVSLHGDGTAPVSMRWVDNTSGNQLGDQPELSNVGPGNYALYVTDHYGCESLVYTTEVPASSMPVIGDASITDATCGEANGSLALQLDGGTAPFGYQWIASNGTVAGTGADLAQAKADTYQVIVTDANKCQVYGYGYTIQNIATTLPAPAAQSITIAKGAPVTWQEPYTGAGELQLFASLPAETPIAVSASGTFSLPPVFVNTTLYLVAKQDVCSSDPARIDIKIVDKVDVIFPTAFSPNNDGHNDVFKPALLGIVSVKDFIVYNRWGEKIFESNVMGLGWDGTFKAVVQPVGAYVYYIEAVDVFGNTISRKGVVSLVR